MGDRDAQARIDAALVLRAQQPDGAGAFEQLVRRHQGLVRAQLRRLLGDDPALADDLAQEVFVLAWRKLDQFRGESRFGTWLYRIAVNTAKNYLTAQGRRPPELDVDCSDAEQQEGAEAMHELASPESLVLSDEIHRMVMATLESLPEDLRTAITLREIEGLSYEEIAEIMGCPVGTVRSRIFRAREAIDNKVQPLIRR